MERRRVRAILTLRVVLGCLNIRSTLSRCGVEFGGKLFRRPVALNIRASLQLPCMGTALMCPMLPREARRSESRVHFAQTYLKTIPA
jgi:hypothetical protein